jgi:hypothetical protein
MRFKLILAMAALLVPSLVWGQGSRSDGVVQGLNGPLPNQNVAVCLQPANVTTTPCSTLATLYTDSTLSTPCTGLNGCSNPTTSDQFGNFHFYATPGKYTLQSYGPQIQTAYVQKDQILPCDPSNCVITTLEFGTIIHNSPNVATTGDIRLQVGDTQCWRNNANSGNLCLSINGSDQIQFPGGFGGGGGGTTININGGAVTSTLNLNDTTPVAGANNLNAKWQYSAGNGSVEVPITGNGSKAVSGSGTYTTNDCLKVDASGNAVDAGSPCGGGFSQVQILNNVTGITCSGDQNVCSTTLTWPSTWADTNYQAVCTPKNPSNTSGNQGLSLSGTFNQTTTQISVAVVSAGSASKSFGGFICVGYHM